MKKKKAKQKTQQTKGNLLQRNEHVVHLRFSDHVEFSMKES